MGFRFLHFILLAVITLCGCNEQASSQNGSALYDQDHFKKYWYGGKAEIVSYKLSQSRYGENHEGTGVLIFVTEPFSKRKQVKLDEPEKAESDKVTILKLNFTKKFVTGIYPYSMMLSVFTPVDRNEYPSSLKTTMSSQEWCGQVFSQMNLNNNEYDVRSYSYFEQEGDESFTLKRTLLEDEIWNIIRLAPENLPIGEVDIIPGLFFSRLSHKDLKTEKATTSRTEKEDIVTYTIQFLNKRSLSISFEKKFPHRILSWKEEFYGSNGKPMTTTADLDKTLITDYWTKNKNEFSHLRDSLGLPTDH